MSQLTITAKGQVTLRKELLRHLGLRPGDRVDVEMRPDHQIGLRPVRRTGTFEGLGAVLAGNSRKVSVETMRRVSAEGWAGRPQRKP
jgi:antitoxin PrlF